MPKYRVTVKRTTEEYTDVIVRDVEDSHNAKIVTRIMIDHLDLSWSKPSVIDREIVSCEEIKE